MKMVKNITIVAFATTFMFAGVSFHMGNNYSNLEGGTAVVTSWGADYDLNENTTLGYDSELGMLFAFTMPAGVSLRFGVDGTSGGAAETDGTSVGLGYTWWTGGAGLKTSISTAYDMCTTNAAGGESSNNLSVTVGFGF